MVRKAWGVVGGLIFLVVIVLVAYLWSCGDNENPLIGTWTSSYTGASGGQKVIFGENSKFEVKDWNDSLYNYGEYRADFSKEPAWIDIIPKRVLWFEGYYTGHLARGIIRFVDKSVIEIAFQARAGQPIVIGESRTTSFEYSYPDNVIIKMTFTKISE